MKLDQMFGYSLQIIFTGNPNGTLKLQGSNDSVQLIKDPVNWTDIQGSSVVITASGNTVYNVTDVMYNWVRVVYTAVSGTGTCVINANGKGT
jgi:hypothetical protein